MKKLLFMTMAIVLVGISFAGCGKIDETVTQDSVITEDQYEEQNQEQNQEQDQQQNQEQDQQQNQDQEQAQNQNQEQVQNDEQPEIGEGIAEEETQIGEKDPTPSDEAYYVATNGLEQPMSMTADDMMLMDAYGVDPEMLASYRVEMAMNRAAVSELAVFEVKDEADIEKVKEGIAKRQKALEEQWEGYLKDQYELVKNSQIAVNGKMVLYVISCDAVQIVEQFILF